LSDVYECTCNRACRPKLFKNLCLSLVSGVPQFFLGLHPCSVYYHFAPWMFRHAKYCDRRVCLSVCPRTYLKKSVVLYVELLRIYCRLVDVSCFQHVQMLQFSAHCHMAEASNTRSRPRSFSAIRYVLSDVTFSRNSTYTTSSAATRA